MAELLQPRSPDPQASRAMPWLAHFPAAVDWHMPLTPLRLDQLLDRAAARYGTRPALTFSGRSISYSQFDRLVWRAAAGLQHLGVAKGDRVGLLLPNVPTYPVYFFAAMRLGAIVVSFNPALAVEELAQQVRDSGTGLMVTVDLAATFDRVQALLGSGTLQQAVVASFAALLPGSRSVLFKLFRSQQLARPTASPVRDRVTLEGDLIGDQRTCTPAAVDPVNDIAVLQYTGGTAGVAKGAMLTHANLSINVQQTTAWSRGLVREGEERMLAVLPLFHIFAMTGVLLNAVAIGAEIVLAPRFQLDETIALIEKARPTLMPGVPTLFGTIMGRADAARLDLRSLKLCLSAGAPLPLAVQQQFEALTGARLVDAYGLSETSPAVACNPLDGRARPGSVGLPLPGTIVSVRDVSEPAREVAAGEPGEICIAGPQVMAGYWRRPEETAAAFTGPFFRSGDIGIIDADGFVSVIDRIGDVIISSGFKVFPRHIEEKIQQHPCVDEVSVIGVRHPRRGEAPKAFVKLRGGASTTAEELQLHLESRLTAFEMPCEIEFRGELPKTVIGKLSKAALRTETQAQARRT
jgi:long-chain acyl-CoA synthetase